MSKGKKYKHPHVVILFICLSLTGITGSICAQETIPEKIYTDTIISVEDSVYSIKNYSDLPDDSVASTSVPAYYQHDDSIFTIFSEPPVTIITENAEITITKNEDSFKPIPKIAFRVALVFPGFGQAYNRQYWKLPIVYGGIMACAYAITWNNKTYKDYNKAYYDIIYDSQNFPKPEDADKWNSSWQNYVADPAARLHDKTFHNNLKRRKDYFRRNRDLSIIVGVAVYFICAADSYIDAQMFDFDVSPDLSFRVTPEFRPETISNSRSYGFNVCMTF